MRAREFVFESKPGKISDDQAGASQGIIKARDVGGYDRTYHMNRLTMAMASANGKSKNAIDMDSSSFAEKYNTVHPYTEEEYNMYIAASKTIPTDQETVVPYSKSKEAEDTQTKSPVLVTKRPSLK
jgi:hypothetical protein